MSNITQFPKVTKPYPVIDLDKLNEKLSHIQAVALLIDSDGENTDRGFCTSHSIIMDAIDCIRVLADEASAIANPIH